MTCLTRLAQLLETLAETDFPRSMVQQIQWYGTQHLSEKRPVKTEILMNIWQVKFMKWEIQSLARLYVFHLSVLWILDRI